MTGTQLNEYFSHPNSYLNRKSTIWKIGNIYEVDMWEGEQLIITKQFVKESLCYVEDCAENWILGVL